MSATMSSLLAEFEHKTLLIWDWNGTILDDVEHNVQTMNELRAAYDLPSLSVDDHRTLFRFPIIDYYRDIGFNTSPEHFRYLSDEYSKRYDAGLSVCQIPPVMKSLLQAMRSLGKVQTVLSASKQDSLQNAIDYFGLTDFFAFVCGLEDNTASSKLQRGRDLLASTGVALEDALLIGDTDHDVEVARDLGIDVLLFAHGHQSYERLSSVCDKVYTFGNSTVN